MGRTRVFAPDGEEVVRALASRKEREANRHLISAAPDLLAALKAVVVDVREYESINNLAPSPGHSDCWQSVTQAEAAIAAAEGKT